jgi:cytochrome c-type biogenesis protein CcmH
MVKTKYFLLFIFFCLVLAVTITPNGTASAQQSTPSDDAVNAIARQLYCPVCENTPLDVCPTTACHQWRELIRQMLAEGKTESEIKQYFVDYYGARVLSEPPVSGINWLVYIVPPAAFLAGVILLFLAFRTWKRTSTAPVAGLDQTSSPGSGFDPSKDTGTNQEKEYIARLEDELKKRK